MTLKRKRVAHGGDYFTMQEEFVEQPYLNGKARRAEELYAQMVEVASATYDAGEKSMDRIDRVLTLAGALFNKTVFDLLKGGGVTMEQAWAGAYQAVYTLRPVPWKMADNTIMVVTVEDLIEVQEQAMDGMKNIWLKYS